MDGFNLIFAGRLCFTAVLRCLFLQHTKATHAWSFPLLMQELHSSRQAARCPSWTGRWSRLDVWKAAGAEVREVFRRCLATAMRRRNVPAGSSASTEEGKRVSNAAGSHRDELQLRGVGVGIMAVQTHSFVPESPCNNL